MKVLVTGGAGNIGISLIQKLLASDSKVVIYDLPQQIEINKKYINPDVKICCGSIMDKSNIAKAIEGCSHVVHLAASLGVKKTESDKKNCLDINILGTKNILDASIDEGISKFLFASSSETYGEPLKTPISENSITQGKTVYAVSKLAGEEFVKAYAQKFTFMNYTIIRFFNVFGPNQVGQFVISKFIQNAKEGTPIIINGDGNQQRAYCYVDDAVRGLILALESEKSNGEVINIGNPNNLTSINDLAKMICNILNIDHSLIKTDPKFENTDRKHEREIFKRYPNVSKARDLLGYTAKVDLEEALDKVINLSSNIRDWPDSQSSNG